MQKVLEQFIFLSIFLLAGYGVRVWFKPVQKLFLPASLIGGFIGLILCPNGFGVIPVTPEMMKELGALPGILITVVITASVLGVKLPKPGELAGGLARNFMHLNVFFMTQIGVGLLVGAVFMNSTYKTFGIELVAGFAGGHGTAAMLGSSLKDMGLDWWLNSQGVGLTTATVGIIGGILIGIGLVTYASKKGFVSGFKGIDQLPKEMIIGYSKPEDAKPMGRQIQYPAAIEPFAFILSLVLISVGLAFKFRVMLTGTVMFRVAPWAWGIIIMAIIWMLICRLRLDWLIDPVAKARLMGTFVDYLVVAAIISLPVRAVWQFIVPITVLCAVGLAVTIFVTMFLGRKMLPEKDWFERSIISFGQCTGVGATGILLLRLVDPDFQTEALSHWSLAFSVISLYFWFLFASLPILVMNHGLLLTGLFFTGLSLAIVVASRVIPGFWNTDTATGS